MSLAWRDGVLSAVRPVAVAGLGLLAATLAWAAPSAGSGLQIEGLTSPELRDRIAGGATTLLVPIGGTEQNGPHMVLGKHNVRARVLATEIAQQLGNALVAPVIAYVPEGTIHPPAAHMRYAGTISIPEPVFEALLEATARSFKQHGLRDIVFLGDHGGYQKSEERVAAKLNREWAGDPACRVHALPEYYRVTQTAYVDELKRRGHSLAEIGSHAGLADTSLALAVDPALVRAELLGPASQAGDRPGDRGAERSGVSGDPRQSSVELGQLGVRRIVDTSVAAIRAATRGR